VKQDCGPRRRKTGGEKLKVKKYSPRLRKHTVHVEKRK
jgi:large subunit ribosomal protein L33